MPRARRVVGLVLTSVVVGASGFVGVASVFVANERVAWASDDEKIDYADGPTACRAFHAKNDHELADWSKTQPATPYAYPMADNVLGAPWGTITGGLGDNADLLVASLVPHFGSQLRSNAPAALISWPWSIPFGPAYTCSRHRGSFTVRDYKFHRALIEPGIVASQRGQGFFTRLGYRLLYHPSDWVVGAGGGLGSTIELTGQREPTRPSISPEAVIQFGHCCDASYFTFAFRYDHFFGGSERDLIGGSLGYTFF